jgi:hypothetical protein
MSDFTRTPLEPDYPDAAQGRSLAPPFGRSAQWGLSSMLCGSLTMIVATMLLILLVLMIASGPGGMHMSHLDTTLATVGFVIGDGLLLLLGVSGVLFGAQSLRTERARHESIALGLAGVLTSVVGLFLMVMVVIESIAVLGHFIRNG